MKHAGADTLDRLESLLGDLRALEGMKERSRGVFYRKGRAFLHFHEDPTGLFADLREDDDFVRHAVTDTSAQRRFLAVVRKAL